MLHLIKWHVVFKALTEIKEFYFSKKALRADSVPNKWLKEVLRVKLVCKIKINTECLSLFIYSLFWFGMWQPYKTALYYRNSLIKATSQDLNYNCE